MSTPTAAIATLPGPFGPYHVAVTERGVAAAGWGLSREAFEDELARRDVVVGDPEAAAALLARLRPSIEAVLAGRPVDAAEVPLDLSDRPVFDRRVLLAVSHVPWGRTASYGEIARQIGAPRAARAVGGAVGRNPVSLLVPCHRVIAADGTLGGYGGDGPGERAEALERKRMLLLREGTTVAVRSG